MHHFVLKINLPLLILVYAISCNAMETETSQEPGDDCVDVIANSDGKFWIIYLDLNDLAVDYIESLDGDLKVIWDLFVKQLASIRLSTDYKVVRFVSAFAEHTRECVQGLASPMATRPSHEEQIYVLANLLSDASSVNIGQPFKREQQKVMLRTRPTVFAKTFPEWVDKNMRALGIMNTTDLAAALKLEFRNLKSHLESKEQLSPFLLTSYAILFRVSLDTIIKEIEDYK